MELNIVWAFIFGMVACLLVMFVAYCFSEAYIREAHEKAEKEKEAKLVERQAELVAYEKKLASSSADSKKRIENFFNAYLSLVQSTMREARQGHPELARQLADLQAVYDQALVDFLRSKPRPAIKQAEEIARIKAEKRELKVQCKMLEYQMSLYESQFPWLEDYKELTVQEIVESAKDTHDSDYAKMSKWMSPDEYNRLTTTERNQRALDIWKNRNRNNVEIGREYERYTGYVYELKGYKVTYFGALNGMEDMGRDILVDKKDEILVVQCKYWSKEKEIHEKHICQLYGTTAVLASQDPTRRYRPVFVTNITLTETAHVFAKFAGIEVLEEFPMEDRPLIKCNLTKEGERIYHLPFDQQYDKVRIGGKRGCCFAWTIQEAEDKGFRRAYKWNPERIS